MTIVVATSTVPHMAGVIAGALKQGRKFDSREQEVLGGFCYTCFKGVATSLVRL